MENYFCVGLIGGDFIPLGAVDNRRFGGVQARVGLRAARKRLEIALPVTTSLQRFDPCTALGTADLGFPRRKPHFRLQHR